MNEPHQIVGGGCTGLPGGTPLRSALTKKGAPHLSASFRRFVYVAGWPWRAGRCERLGGMPERPEKKREPTQPATRRVLPMELQGGDRFVNETGEWEVVEVPA